MKIIQAQAMGMCFGVRDALALAAAVPHPDQTTIYGELVHNAAVQEDLRARGFHLQAETDRGELPATEDVLVTPHGISERDRQQLLHAGKQLTDATCPLVRRVHLAALTLKEEGRTVIVIGRPQHVEVKGVVGDLEHYVVVSAPEEAARYDAERLGIVFQTTTAPQAGRRILDRVLELNQGKDIRVIPTICRPTLDRQAAMRSLLGQVDAVVVVGGKNSNNTLALVALARERNVPCLHVQHAGQLVAEWFHGYDVVGLTAGTSTPDHVTRAVLHRLEEIEPGEEQRLRATG